MTSLQYNWKYRIYKNGSHTSSNFDDLVNKAVRVHITKDMYYPHTGKRTPFSGIDIVPYEDCPELKEYLSRLIPARSRTYNIWDKFKKALFKGWMPGKIHLIGASSGYDSRLIAKAIQELRSEHGSSWMGETYFVELGGEGSGFKQIMDALDFKNYIIVKPNYNFEYFENIHERFNGLCAYPVNQWYDYYVSQWNEEDIQYISGYGGNVADAMSRHAIFLKPIKNRLNTHQRLQLFFKWNYTYQLSAFKEPKYSFHPFWTWDYITAVTDFVHREPKMSMHLAKYRVKECNHVRRMTILGDVTGAGHRTVSPKEMKKLYWWFKSTRYGKRNKIKPNPQIEYNRWWLEFCIASYVEANNIDLC